jgi:hypothetical protein
MAKQCPNEETLIDFLENRLPDRQRSRIEDHLAGCFDCREQVGAWIALGRDDALIAVEPVPAAVTRKAVDAVAELTAASLPGRLLERTRRLVTQGMAVIEQMAGGNEARPVAMRGEQTAVSDHVIQRRKTYGDLDLRIEIEKCGRHRALIRVAGGQGRPLAAPIRVVLCKAQREVASMVLDDAPVVFEEISFGFYALVFMRSGVKLGEYLFELTDAPASGIQTSSSP